MAARDKADDLTLREAADALGLSVGTVRAHIKAGRLVASKSQGKYGPEFKLRPAVVAAFAAERLGMELDAATLGKGAQASEPEAVADDVRDLYERLVTATEEASRYKALNAASEGFYQGELARLQQERDAADARAAAERARADEAAADLARLRARGFWGRLFGGE